MNNIKEIEKTYPEVGEHLYLSNQPTGNYYLDAVKTPFTVAEVTETHVVVRRCRLIFHNGCYYDSIADEIVDNPAGELVTLHFNKKVGWYESPIKYGRVAHFGEWKHYPYKD